MIAATARHRALVEVDETLRRPLTTSRRIGVAALGPACGVSTTVAEITAAIARRRPGPADVVVSDLGVRPAYALAPAGPRSHALCLVTRAEPAAATAALDAATAYPGPVVLAVVEVEPAGGRLLGRLRRASPVPLVVVRHEPALRLPTADRPRRMPYAYRVAHLALAAALMRS